MDKREILTRFRDGTLERRHTLALLSGPPAPAPTRTPAPAPPAGKRTAPPATAEPSGAPDEPSGTAPDAAPATAPRARRGPARPASAHTAPCAVIGIQGHLPHAGDLDALWRRELTAPRTSRPLPQPGTTAHDTGPRDPHPSDTDVSDTDVSDTDVSDTDPSEADLSAADTHGARSGGARFGGADFLDAAALGLTDSEAELIGAGERSLLHSARQVLESAGYAGVRLDALSGPDGQRRCVGVFTAVTAAGRPQEADPGGAAARLSHLLDLRGPSRHVGTGPSSFLTALHLGLAALRAGECAAALVAAAEPGPDGAGAGAVLLKPLDAARRCADVVHAVVLAGASAHPGRGPQPGLPDRLCHRAVRAAGIPRTAVAVEETGQPAGSVGGAVPFLRALLQLKYATLLPGPGRPQPGAWRPASLADGEAWPRIALAGVHEAGAEHAVVVLQEPPPAPVAAAASDTPPAQDAAEPALVLLSAPTPAHLAATAAQLAGFLTAAGRAGGPRPPGPAGVARELRLGRAAHPCRLAVVTDRTDRLADALAAFAAGTAPPGVRTADLRAQRGGPLLLAGLAETSAYLGALWQRHHFEQLTRLWLAGADVLTAAPGDDGAPVLELPAGPPPHRPGDHGPDGGTARARGERQGGQP
ncbi:beta-ketoacyl synthase N-terminal-like domain-containing protein [Streptomyces sp. NPDC059701]|uniref:beta-ketoacyl synthase N-terminal-like domain-containing protein n=1 Tax=Streptomyces sp. NPDC059701 TaxID=3346914 RepID=UPI0036C2B051